MLRGVALAGGDAALAAELRFLQASGPRHEAEERRVSFAARPLAELAAEPARRSSSTEACAPSCALSAARAGAGRHAVELRVDNTTPFEAPRRRPRRGARGCLLSTLPFLRLGGAFRLAARPRTAAPTRSENTFPVLATADDDVLLGATIVLPEHPQIAPESRGDLFDGTEIEEALLLHVLALSDDERASIARDDPAVRAMIERAAAATPAEILALHGRMTLSDQGALVNGLDPHLSQDTPGEAEVTVDGTTFRLGDTVTLRLDGRSDPYDRILDGRRATIERIYLDYEDKLVLRRHDRRRPRAAADARDGALPVLLRRRDRALEGVMSERFAQILIAGVGNAWMRDDGFGGEVVRGLRQRELPTGVIVEDFGTGGLDLAYEVMRGYDALILLDVTRGRGAARHALRARARGGRDRRRASRTAR